MTADTTPTPFAARLRALSKDASPGPWRLNDSFAGVVCRADHGVVADCVEDDDAEPDAVLIVALRNHADRLADLDAAARDVLAAYDALAAGKPMPAHGSIDRLRAALDALDGGGA